MAATRRLEGVASKEVDFDTGAGSELLGLIGIAVPGSGGATAWTPTGASGNPTVVDTELPAAVALSDALANPTAPAVGAYLLGWDGTQWVRVDVSAAGKLLITDDGSRWLPAAILGNGALGDGAVAFTMVTGGQGTGTASAQAYVHNGTTSDRERAANIFTRFSALGTGAEVTIHAPAAGKKFRLLRGLLASSVAGDIELRDNTAGTIILTIPVTAGVAVPFDLGKLGKISAAANNVLTADAPGAGTLSGWVGLVEE